METTVSESANDVSTLDHDDVETINVEDVALSDEARHARWQARRPDTSHLKSAVAIVNGTTLPLFDVGDRIVVDRRTALLKGTPWLDTTVGRVRSIDDELGLVTVLDEDGDQRNPPVKYFSLIDGLHLFFLAPARGNPFDAPRVARDVNVRAAAAVNVSGEPRKRGRPPGSKNRPKEVILAERARIKAEREAKRARRRGFR